MLRVDFTDSFAPVMADTTFRIILIFVIINKWDTALIDVEAAFLNGKLFETIYMKTPEGMNIPKTKGLLLRQAIYGLVQAARQWWKTFSEFLISDLNFSESPADTCLLTRTSDKGQVLFGLYVDD